jgi:16S rRNA G527 N7-methylase RsmG
MINIQSDKLLNQYLDRSRLSRWLDEVQRANEKFNLYSRHFQRRDLELLTAESLIPLDRGWIDQSSGPLLDIGSGWGIPVVPVLLSGLEIEITMVERSQKKADFLLLMFHRLGLKANIIAGDIIDLAPETIYSQITLRGVALDKKIRRRLRNAIKPGGELIYFGSSFPEDWLISAQSFEYSIDNLPVRNIIKYTFD